MNIKPIKVIKQGNTLFPISEDVFKEGEGNYLLFLKWRKEKKCDDDVTRIDLEKDFSFLEITQEDFEKYCEKKRYQHACLNAAKSF